MEILGTPRCTDALEFRDVGGQIAVSAPRLRRKDVVDRTDAWILILCDGRNTVDEIIDAIAKATRGERNEVQQRVVTSLAALTSMGYLEGATPEPAADEPQARSDTDR